MGLFGKKRVEREDDDQFGLPESYCVCSDENIWSTYRQAAGDENPYTVDVLYAAFGELLANADQHLGERNKGAKSLDSMVEFVRINARTAPERAIRIMHAVKKAGWSYLILRSFEEGGRITIQTHRIDDTASNVAGFLADNVTRKGGLANTVLGLKGDMNEANMENWIVFVTSALDGGLTDAGALRLRYPQHLS